MELAVASACKALNIPREQLKHEVIRFGATGIFGLVGVKKARIRVATPGIQAQAPAAPDAQIRPLQTDPPDSLPAPSQIQKPDSACHSPRSPMIADSAMLGSRVLQQLVDSVTSGAEILANCGSRQIVYTISGGEPAAIIGKRGQTLEAIQYLLNKIVNKSAEDRTRIIVDIAGYASKRRNDLHALALTCAEKACKNEKSVIVGRFNPQERKIIHLALKNDPRVKTQSKGEGYVKKLAVIPRGE